MTMRNSLRQILRQAIDLHVHIGPEVIPRKYTVETLIKAEQDKLTGVGIKNHFYPTTPFISSLKIPKNFLVIGSVTLNNYVGGSNSWIIYATAEISKKPIIVWFPTINASNFLTKSKYEIPPGWVKNRSFKFRKSGEINGIKIVENSKITERAYRVLKAIKNTNAILATGHISWLEAKILVEKAVDLNIEKIIITHPIYQIINMPIGIQKKLAERGAFIEHSYSMHAIDKIPIKKIANQIKAIGAKRCILTSDVGQTFSPSPSRALKDFARLLSKEGISLKEISQMMVANPRKLLKL